MVALALILEAGTGVSADEVIEATVRDWRGPLVLDGLDTEEAPVEPRNTGGFSAAADRTNHGDGEPEPGV